MPLSRQRCVEVAAPYKLRSITIEKLQANNIRRCCIIINGNIVEYKKCPALSCGALNLADYLLSSAKYLMVLTIWLV